MQEELDGKQSVGEFAAHRPGAVAVLRDIGIDACCRNDQGSGGIALAALAASRRDPH